MLNLEKISKSALLAVTKFSFKMFLIIPLILIFGSLLAAGYIVLPKIKEMKSKEDLPEIKENITELIFPEIPAFFKKINFEGFKKNLLIDYEKFLRKIRILSLKTDNIIYKLLEKRAKSKEKPEFKEEISQEKIPQQDNLNHNQLKNKETQLIAEIAKNPKDKNLYKILAAFYLENKMFEDAKEALKVVIELDPNDREAKRDLRGLSKNLPKS